MPPPQQHKKKKKNQPIRTRGKHSLKPAHSLEKWNRYMVHGSGGGERLRRRRLTVPSSAWETVSTTLHASNPGARETREGCETTTGRENRTRQHAGIRAEGAQEPRSTLRRFSLGSVIISAGAARACSALSRLAPQPRCRRRSAPPDPFLDPAHQQTELPTVPSLRKPTERTPPLSLRAGVRVRPGVETENRRYRLSSFGPTTIIPTRFS